MRPTDFCFPSRWQRAPAHRSFPSRLNVLGGAAFSRRRGPLRWAREGSREGVFFPAPASRSTPLTPLSRSSPKGRALALSPSPSTNAKIASPQCLVKDLRHPRPEMPSPVRWRAPHAARCPFPDAVLLDPPCSAPWLCRQRDGPRRFFAHTLPPRAAFFWRPAASRAL